MITLVLFIIIGIKLDIMNGWYLGMIITSLILRTISIIIKAVKIGQKLS